MKKTNINKTRPTARRAVWKAAMTTAALVLMAGSNAFSALVQPFTAGDLVVYRVGSGSAALSSASTPVFLDEYTPGGVLLQSVAMPTNLVGSQYPVTASGTATSEGLLNLSVDNGYLIGTGYGTNIGVAAVASTASAINARVIVRVDANGNIDSSTALFNWASANNPRSATSVNGTAFWGAGAANSPVYATLGATTGTQISTTVANERSINIFNGQLYITTSSGSAVRLGTVGTGTPTTSGQTIVNLPSFETGGSPYGFAFCTLNGGGSPDTVYVADDGGGAGIQKWSLSGGAWSLKGTITGAGAVRGLTASVSGTTVTLYGTTGASGAANSSFIYSVVDSAGYDAAPSTTAVTTNVIAALNTAIRGIAFAPTATAVAQAPNITGINPASQSVSIGGTATFTLSGFTGNPIASNSWYKISGGTTNLLGSQTGPSLVLSSLALSDSASYFAILSNATGSATSGVVSLTVTATPVISGIAPLSVATNAGSTVVYTLTASLGVPSGVISWYKISNSVPVVTNLIAGATTTNLTLSNVTTNDTANYFAIITNTSGAATSSIVSLLITNFPPVITSITPANVTTNVGDTVIFTVANTGTPPFTYQWYKVTAGPTTTLIPGATNTTLRLDGVLASDIAGYQVVIANGSPFTTTSSVVSIVAVIGDPSIGYQPGNTYGLLNGTIHFHVSALASSPSYQWYYSDGAGNLGAMVTDGALTGGSVVSGSTSATLNIANLQTSDATTITNLVVVVSNTGGSAQSQPASLLSMDTSGVALAFWDFNGTEFTNPPVDLKHPATYIGAGTASAVGQCDFPGTSPFSGAVDPNNAFGSDGAPFFVYPPSLPAGFPGHAANQWFSWGVSAFPLIGSNKMHGVQFNVSSAGARHLRLSYQSRVSATASEYERVQFTTNGTDWIDYPTSFSFNGIAGGNNWLLGTNDFTGFPAVDNNPNFGVRVVSEWQNTATYGVGTTNTWVGTANLYTSGGNTTLNTSAGTVTYDVVTLYGDAITDANAAPVIAGLVDTNTLDYISVTNNFTVSDDTTPDNSLTYSVTPLDPSVGFSYSITGTGPNHSLIITPNSIPVSVAASPVMLKVTDANGAYAVSWFTLTLVSSNLPPTNSLVKLGAVGGTNAVANTTLTIPFYVNDDHTTNTALTDYSVASGNNTLVPAANIVVGNTGTTNPTVTITPAHNQLGIGLVSVSLSDDDVLEPKTTTATIPFMVRPNTNVVLIDYFNYDTPGSLDAQAAGFWTQLSGNFGQVKVGLDGGIGAPNTARIDASSSTENVEAALLGAPYRTNSGSVLYASYTINLPDNTKMPLNNGTYVTAFNDGKGNQFTANVEGLLVVATNNATPGFYRLGVGNRNGATFLTSTQFPVDLQPGSNYVVVTALVVSNGFTTLWVNPQSQTSFSVTDTTPAATPTNLYNIVKFELRESGQPNGGQVNLGQLKIGTTFDSVLPAPHVQIVGTNAVISWSDPTIGLKVTTDLTLPFISIPAATTPYTNALSPFNTLFFQLGQ